MRQILVSSLDRTGKFLAVSDLSRGAKKGGVDMRDVVGSKVWDFCDDATKAKIQNAFARCVIHGERPAYTVSSKIGTVEEHWECLLLPSHGAEVVAYAREVMRPQSVELSSDDRIILRALADDHTVDEIAEQVGQLASTIATRIKRIRTKCGFRTNHGLVAWCLRYGML